MESYKDQDIIPSTSVQETVSDVQAQESTSPGEILATAPNAPTKPSPLAQKLATLVASANKQYGLKNYSQASDLYAQAAEIQDSINGEGNPENADILYYYGRSLFHCGLAKSDILGDGLQNQTDPAKKDVIAKPRDKEPTAPQKKGMFSFQGDENFVESDDEEAEDVEAEGGDNDEEGEEEEEDDFTLAFGILDHARNLYIKRLESQLDDTSRTDFEKRLADIYDLLGEISLESESWAQAVTDLTAGLTLKEKLYGDDSTIIAEAHYKLSLALEFASQNPPEGDNVQDDAGEGSSKAEANQEDKPAPLSEEEQKAGRELAAKHTKLAIESCQKRIANEEKTLETASDKTIVQKSLDDAKDLVKELEQRFKDLMAPPSEKSLQEIQNERQDVVNSVLQQMMAGTDAASAKKILEQAISGANDLGSVVRKKAKAPPTIQESDEYVNAAVELAAQSATTQNGANAAAASTAGQKRKAEDDDVTVIGQEPTNASESSAPTKGSDMNSKKVRITTEEEESATTLS